MNLPLLHLFHLLQVKRSVCFFSVTFVSSYFSSTNSVRNICFFRFMMWAKNNGITIESTFVTFVSVVTGEKIILFFFLLLLFRLILHPPILLEISVAFVT